MRCAVWVFLGRGGKDKRIHTEYSLSLYQTEYSTSSESNAMKNPSIVRNITEFAVRTKPQAPPSICGLDAPIIRVFPRNVEQTPNCGQDHHGGPTGEEAGDRLDHCVGLCHVRR